MKRFVFIFMSVLISIGAFSQEFKVGDTIKYENLISPYVIMTDKEKEIIDKVQREFIREHLFAGGKSVISDLCRSDMYNWLDDYEKIREKYFKNENEI